jgi:hypothetical protein
VSPDLFDTAVDVLRLALLYAVALFLPLTLQLLLLFAAGRLFVKVVRGIASAIITLLVAIGTPLHELSHALACLVTFTGVAAIKLVSDEAGVANVKPKRANPIGAIAVSLAPLFGGTLVLWLTATHIIPGFESPTIPPPQLSLESAASLGMVLREALDYLGRFVQTAYESLPGMQWDSWRTYAGLYIAFSVGLGIAPSGQDLRIMLTALPLATLLGVGAFALFYLVGDAEAQFAALQQGLWPHLLKFSTAVTYAFVLTSLGILVFLPLRLFSEVRRSDGAVTPESGEADTPHPPLSGK